ncbi:PspC domain-containing protein [Nonomuraea sp. ZG12]|uniref:PspC domain-containing protein n=1 Tax=Nonomuraea sp. ZG12 TaxID=3452207 RepID=UPI003F8AFE67
MTHAPPREPVAPPSALRRSSEGRFLMGVCAGLGRHTGIDPVVFRVGFAVLLFGSGIGLFLYIAALLLMKEPNGGPGLIEQWTRRDFDADTVFALLTAVLAVGLGLNVSTVWLGTGTLVVGLVLAVSLLAAHAHGVDLLGLARSMPERLNRRRRQGGLDEPAGPGAPSVPQASPPTARPFPEPTTTAHAHAGAQAPEAPEARQVPEAPAAPEPTAKPEETVRRAVPEQDASTATTAEFPTAAARPLPVDNDEIHTYGTLSTGAEDRPSGETENPPYRTRADEPRHPDPYPYHAPSGVPRRRPGPYEQQRPMPGTAAHAAYGEPFAPRGPYQPLDPMRRGGYSPYDPALYGRPVRPPREKRPKSFIGVITILLALIVGGIVVAVQAASPSGVHPTLVAGAMLVTIGGGLLIAAWWGRGAGLVAAGTVVAMLIGVGLMFGGLPSKVGASVWHPTRAAESGRLYDAGVGDGRLDLSELRLDPGSRVTFNASVSVGQLTVIVPPTARVEVHASNKLGDIQVDQSLRGGVDVRFDKVLAPEVKPEEDASTIVLNLRGGVGDLEVRRGA